MRNEVVNAQMQLNIKLLHCRAVLLHIKTDPINETNSFKINCSQVDNLIVRRPSPSFAFMQFVLNRQRTDCNCYLIMMRLD